MAEAGEHPVPLGTVSPEHSYGHKETTMKMKRAIVGSLAAIVLIAGFAAYAQVNRPYHNGSVWDVAFIRMKPGMETKYLEYIAGQWKAEQEAQKKDGNILSYKVLTVEGHNANEFNIMLMTE